MTYTSFIKKWVGCGIWYYFLLAIVAKLALRLHFIHVLVGFTLFAVASRQLTLTVHIMKYLIANTLCSIRHLTFLLHTVYVFQIVFDAPKIKISGWNYAYHSTMYKVRVCIQRCLMFIYTELYDECPVRYIILFIRWHHLLLLQRSAWFAIALLETSNYSNFSSPVHHLISKHFPFPGFQSIPAAFAYQYEV